MKCSAKLFLRSKLVRLLVVQSSWENQKYCPDFMIERPFFIYIFNLKPPRKEC